MPKSPQLGCSICPRLHSFLTELKRQNSDWYNEPVMSFGQKSAELLIVGLAPGMHGANRTGRPFTGDYAGILLYKTLAEYGFSKGTYQERAGDGLELVNARITNAVRCLPPENKPLTSEIHNCRPFLQSELETLPKLKVILTLGLVAHNSTLDALELRKSFYKFGHGAVHKLPDGRVLINSYHCSRYNTNTGRLTEVMFHDVFESVKKAL